MIVVPTEKQLDWRHAPLVLFSIVLLNVFIFFTYQSGDNEKLLSAVESYLEHDFLREEWPHFEAYLQEQEDTTTQENAAEVYDTDDQYTLAMLILQDEGFYQHLNSIAENEFEEEFYATWANERPKIRDKVRSLSWIAHGIVPGDFKISSLLTHQFLHGGVMHLLGNMFFLVICGFAVEAAVGHWRFLAFYLLSGVAAGLFQAISDWSSTTPLVGASGSISGVMAMYLAVFRLRKIEFFYWIFFFVGYFRAPALVILPFYIGKEVFSYYTDPESNVAFLAHAGGFVAGSVLIAISLLLDKKTINEDYIENEQKFTDENQESLAEIYQAIEKYRFSDAYTLLNKAIKIHGETFELAMIRYNLLKINRGKSFPQSIVRLWQQQRLLPHELERLENLWQKHPEYHQLLRDEYAIRLGIQFAKLENPVAAEQVFELLKQRKHRSQDFIVFTQKLSHVFQQQGNQKKSAKYDAYIQQTVNEGHNGAL